MFMSATQSYWRKTGAKFTGTEKEFEKKYTDCCHSMPWTDEEGYFNSWLCIKDCKECDFQCSKHLKLNPDIKEFVEHFNKHLEETYANGSR